MNLKNVSKSTPIKPEIECDGWYTYCSRCFTEIEPCTAICPKCKQIQDWSWFGKDEKHEEN